MSARYDATYPFGSESLGHSEPKLDLPQIPDDVLDNILSRLNEAELRLALRQKIVPIAWLPHLTLFAVVDGVGCSLAGDLAFTPVARIGARQFNAAVRRKLGSFLLSRAIGLLKNKAPILSAHHRFSRPQVFWFIMFLAYAALGFVLLRLETMLMVFSLILSLFFLSVVALRLLSVLSDNRQRTKPNQRLKDNELPVYSVLVPLYRETSVLQQLIGALDQLDYPQPLLDIKLILEENDVVMHRAVAALDLPNHFEVIVVPVGKPQTKPRAMNYALQFSRGELLTIYDAEDIPEPDQLRKAVAAFRKGPAQLACVQAELTFYNANENWLTRQ
ncbi:MAG: glycosyltransferase, partial [Alphaproteobacteria bacterium]|nr:glycosyltransferase [Alphaproteobacteria bacterium]